MKLSKNGIKVLTAQYRAILKKCLLINMGLFIWVGQATAADKITENFGSENTETKFTGIELIGKNNITITNAVNSRDGENGDYIIKKSTATIINSDMETSGDIFITDNSHLTILCSGDDCGPQWEEEENGFGPGYGFLGTNVTIKDSYIDIGNKEKNLENKKAEDMNDKAYMGANNTFVIDNSVINVNGASVFAYEGTENTGKFEIKNNTHLTLNDYAELNIGEIGETSDATLEISESHIILNDYAKIQFLGDNKGDTTISSSSIKMNNESVMSLNNLKLIDSTISMKGNSELNVTDVTLENSSIKGNKNVINFSGNVEFSGLFDPARAIVNGDVITRKLANEGYDDAIDWTITKGTLKYDDDKILYALDKHTHNIDDTNRNEETNTFSDGKYALNAINFNGGTLDIANKEVTNIKLASLKLSKDSNIMLSVDLAGRKMDRFSDDTPIVVENDARLNVSELKLLSDAKEEKTTINFTNNNTLKDAVSYQNNTIQGYSPIYSYDVKYENGDFIFTRGGGSSVSDYNPAIYASSVAGHTVDFLQYNIANTAFNALSSNSVVQQGLASGDMPKANNAWVSVIGFDDNVDFDKFQTVDSEMMSVIGGVTSDKTQTSLGETTYGVYAGYLDGEQKYNGNKLDQKGGYIGLGTEIRDNQTIIQGTINTGFISNEDKHSFGNDKFDTYWTGIALKGGYDYKLDETTTLQPNIYTSYTFVNSEDYTSKSGSHIKNDNLHLWEIAPGIKANKKFENGWNGFVQAKYAIVMNNGGDTTVDTIALPNISTKNYVEYGVGADKNLNDSWDLSASINRRDGGREGWNGNLNIKYNF